MPPQSIEEYQVGWVCALPKEMTAAQAALDEEYEPFKSHVPQDNNNYILGRVGRHNVVIACLPAGIYGTNAAASVANNMLRTFTGLRFGLMVGIGAGIPDPRNVEDIRLGDVVVSQPDGTYGGVVQYDLMKNFGWGKFERKGSLNMPPQVLLTALAIVQAKPVAYAKQVSENVSQMLQHPELENQGYAFPGAQQDHLACPSCERWRWQWRSFSLVGLFGLLWLSPSSWYMHVILLFPLWWFPSWWCKLCVNGRVLRALNRIAPKVHYGVIASGNQLMKNMIERDRLGKQFKAKCIEMEAAGLMNNFPCMVIRGICDYADAYKNDAWQKYAATTAAAFAKALLSVVLPTDVAGTNRATDAMMGE